MNTFTMLVIVLAVSSMCFGFLLSEYWHDNYDGTEKLPISTSEAIHSLEVARQSHIDLQPDDGWVERYTEIIELLEAKR